MPVSFSLGEAIPRAICALANADSRKGALVANTDACLDTNIPVLGDCGAESLAEQTSELGAVAQVILGGVPDADYPITITASGFPERVVTVTSHPFGNCNGELPPQHDLVIKDINLTDRFGTNLNAAGVGKSIPMLARMYAVSEEGQEVRKQSNCFPGDTATCPYFVGTRQYRVDTEFSAAAVTFADQTGVNLGAGLFRIDNLPVGTTPGRKTVTITGNASKKIRKPDKVCDRNEQCTLGEEDLPMGPISFTKEIFAVDIALAGSSYAIPVDTQGYALIDTLINYTILPADYAAGNAMVMFYQRQPQGEWEPPFLSLESESRSNGFVTLARGFRFDPDKEYKAQVVLNQSSNGGEIVSGEMVLTPSVVEIGMNPDYNRDGFIDDQDQGLVTHEKPWRFWVNDDDDKDSDPSTGLTTDGLISDPDDLPGQDEDNDDNQVNGIRDLVDFFALKLDLRQALSLLPPEQGYRYFLKNADAALGVVEGIATGVVLTADHASEHLENPSSGILFGGLGARAINAAAIELSSSFLQAVKDNPQAGIVLLEGRKPTTAPLVLEVRDKSGMVVISQGFPLEFVAVEEMYGHKNLRAEAGGAGGETDRLVNFTDQNSPGYYLKVKQPYCMQGENKNLVWMHGYNVSPENAQATYAEVFKRFFHAGLTGRFIGVSWYGDPPAVGAPHYHQAVVNAFATAEAYRDFINTIPSDATTLAAHSLGNLVVGLAIHDHGLQKFNKYFSLNASVALEAYGDYRVDNPLIEEMVNVGDWPPYLVAGQDRLLASEWYKLFASSDNRSQLTWRNRLGKVVSEAGAKMYNFYSSTEDVFRSYSDDDLVFDGSGSFRMSVWPRYSWAKQEKFKGRLNYLVIGGNLGGAASPYCGWNFRDSWLSRPSPAEAADISIDALRTSPFFALHETRLFIHGSDLDNLVGSDADGVSPSDFVMKLVKDTPLAGYYGDNQATHTKVKVRDWLLAEAFPATTLAMGANENNVMRNVEDQNINMSADRGSRGCKTNEALWPRSSTLVPGIRDWWHSDYKDVPYQHTYVFYEKIKSLIGN